MGCKDMLLLPPSCSFTCVLHTVGGQNSREEHSLEREALLKGQNMLRNLKISQNKEAFRGTLAIS